MNFPSSEIERAAAVIRGGGLVAFPTETVYGLGGNALDANAVRAIFSLKGRPASSPLIVHVDSIAMARELAAEWLAQAQELAERHWPGPLTIVVPKKPHVPDEVTAGLTSVALRMPSHPIALALIKTAGLPIAAPSANRFTQLSPTTAQHVRDAFGTDAPMILDGGPTEVGIESTVVSVLEGKVKLLRPGMLIIDAERVLNPESGAHPSPGLHPKHYAPRTRLVLTKGELPPGRGCYLSWNGRGDVLMPSCPAAYAALLYSKLHELDSRGYDWIAVEVPPETREWEAIHDRLRRAAE